jgi:lactobin A/cerein 7B family class IIb bacteriocin
MNLVREQEMQQIRGGAVKWGIIAGIGAFASFMIGVLDGWTNTKKCNK